MLPYVAVPTISNQSEIDPSSDLPNDNVACFSLQVPFLSLGQEDVGERTERSRGNSKFSGEFVVEDVSVNGECFRRLVFLNNPNLTQSEAKLKIGRPDKSRTFFGDFDYKSNR